MIAQDFMTKNVLFCKQTQTVEEAAAIMSENGFSVMPVVDDEGILVGILTESDFISKEVKIPHAMASMKKLLGVTHYEGNIEEIYASAKKRKLEEEAKNLSLYYQDVKGNKSFDMNQFQAIKY